MLYEVLFTKTSQKKRKAFSDGSLQVSPCLPSGFSVVLKGDDGGLILKKQLPSNSLFESGSTITTEGFEIQIEGIVSSENVNIPSSNDENLNKCPRQENTKTTPNVSISSCFKHPNTFKPLASSALKSCSRVVAGGGGLAAGSKSLLSTPFVSPSCTSQLQPEIAKKN